MVTESDCRMAFGRWVCLATLEEVRPGPAEREQPYGLAEFNDRAGPGGQRQHEIVFEPRGDLDVGVSGRHQPKQFPLTRSESGCAAPASLGVLVNRMQMRTQQLD